MLKHNKFVGSLSESIRPPFVSNRHLFPNGCFRGPTTAQHGRRTAHPFGEHGETAMELREVHFQGRSCRYLGSLRNLLRFLEIFLKQFDRTMQEMQRSSLANASTKTMRLQGAMEQEISMYSTTVLMRKDCHWKIGTCGRSIPSRGLWIH